MNRRNLLKNLVTGSAIVKQPAKTIAETMTKPVTNTIKAVRTYDNAVKTIAKKGNNVLGRRRFLDRTKQKLGEIAIRNPKETNRILGGGKNRLKRLFGNLQNLDPMSAAEKIAKVKLNRIDNITKNFSKKSLFLADHVEFALPKSYFQQGTPKYRSVTRRLHVRKLYGGMGASKVAPSTSLIQTMKPAPTTKKINPLKLKKRWF